jgi:hypothetical protein
MGQVVVKANGEWVCLDVEVDGKGRTKTVYMCACIKPTCLNIYVYNSRDDTSSMSGHTCSCVAAVASSSNNLAVWASKRDMPTNFAKANMTNALINMCSWDIRPFSLMEGTSFKNVIQTAFDIGFASKMPLLTKDLLQFRKTIKRNTMVRFDKGVLKLQVILCKHFINNGHIALSTDIWTDNATKTVYSANTLHMIDDNWVMHTRVMSCDEFSEGTSHNVPAIHRNFVNNVRSFISWKEDEVTVQAADWQVVAKSYATSNNNETKGMSSQFKLDLCYCHRLLTCISYVLQKQTCMVGGVKQPAAYLFYEESELVFDTIDDAKALVTYMKKTFLNKKLHNKMKRDVAMGFDDLLIMLQSVVAELAMSIELLEKRKQEKCAECIIEPLLIELIRLLHYFKLASKSLEPFFTPTIHLVGMWFAKLTAHLQLRVEPVTVNDADNKKVTIIANSDEIGPIKALLLGQLMEKYFLKPLHATTTYVDPLQKNHLLDCDFTQELIDHDLLYLKDLTQGWPTQVDGGVQVR